MADQQQEKKEKQVQTYRYNNFMGGWSTQPIERAALGQMRDWLNFRINRQGFLAPRKGYAKLCPTDLGGDIMGLAYHMGSSAVAPFFVVMTSTGAVYKILNDGVYAATLVSSGLSGSYRWRYIDYDDVTINPILIALNGSDAARKISKTGVVSTLGGSPPHGGHGLIYKGCALISAQAGPGIYHSNQLDIENGWTQVIVPPVGSNERVRGLYYSGGVPIAFYHNSIWALYGNTPVEFFLSQKADMECGTENSIASNGQDIFFMSAGGHIFRYNHSKGFENIGREVEQSLSSVSPLDKCRGWWNPASREYWLSVSENGSEVTHTYVWNEEGYWIRYDIPIRSIISVFRSPVSGSASGVIFGKAGSNYLYIHTPNVGSIVTDDGANMVCSVKTPWTMYGAADAVKRVSWYNVIGNVSASTSFSFKTHYRNTPRGSETTESVSYTATTLPQNKALTHTIEAREFSYEFVGNQKTFLDEIAIGVEITRYDRRT